MGIFGSKKPAPVPEAPPIPADTVVTIKKKPILVAPRLRDKVREARHIAERMGQDEIALKKLKLELAEDTSAAEAKGLDVGEGKTISVSHIVPQVIDMVKASEEAPDDVAALIQAKDAATKAAAAVKAAAAKLEAFKVANKEGAYYRLTNI